LTSATSTPADRRRRPRVALFVTCLADLFRPSVAFASVTLLKAAGCRVSVPEAQTCCGQPGYNSGDYAGAGAVARRVIELFESADYVVAPSGSCAGMITRHYPRLLEGDWKARAQALARRTWEISTFLTEIMPLPDTGEPDPSLRDRRIAYHDGCAGLRELDIREQPRTLLRKHAGVDVLELDNRDVCCGVSPGAPPGRALTWNSATWWNCCPRGDPNTVSAPPHPRPVSDEADQRDIPAQRPCRHAAARARG